MKEYPMPFNTPMVQAILERLKTQTRRVVKKPFSEWINDKNIKTEWADSLPSQCPYGQPGDLLYVRETWMKNPNIEWFPNEPIYFKASKSAQFLKEWPRSWKPSIHMPKAVARIWLEIEEVKVERLQDISEEDAKAEGVSPDLATDHPKGVYYTAFSDLWSKINGNGSWISNPWVWVIKFKVLSTTGKPSFDSAQDDKQPETSNQQLV